MSVLLSQRKPCILAFFSKRCGLCDTIKMAIREVGISTLAYIRYEFHPHECDVFLHRMQGDSHLLPSTSMTSGVGR